MSDISIAGILSIGICTKISLLYINLVMWSVQELRGQLG